MNFLISVLVLVAIAATMNTCTAEENNAWNTTITQVMWPAIFETAQEANMSESTGNYVNIDATNVTGDMEGKFLLAIAGTFKELKIFQNSPGLIEFAGIFIPANVTVDNGCIGERIGFNAAGVQFTATVTRVMDGEVHFTNEQ